MNNAIEFIETNKDFFNKYLDGEFANLNKDNYEYKQINYYDTFDIEGLKIQYDLELSELKDAYNSYKYLINIVHYLDPINPVWMEKFPPIETFDIYIKKSIEERNEELEELKDEKMRFILLILLIKEDVNHYYYFIRKLIGYMSQYKDFLKSFQ